MWRERVSPQIRKKERKPCTAYSSHPAELRSGFAVHYRTPTAYVRPWTGNVTIIMLLWIVGYIGNSLCLLELGRYIADIDISVSVLYRHFRYRFFRYIDIVSMTSEISVIFRFFIRLLFRLFNVNYMIKVEYFIWQCDTSVTNGRLRLFGHIARSSPREDHHRALAACIWPVPPDWKRPARRPSHTWLHAIEADLGPLNFGIATAWRKATARDKWRHIVDTATLQRSTLWKKEEKQMILP